MHKLHSTCHFFRQSERLQWTFNVLRPQLCIWRLNIQNLSAISMPPCAVFMSVYCTKCPHWSAGIQNHVFGQRKLDGLSAEALFVEMEISVMVTFQTMKQWEFWLATFWNNENFHQWHSGVDQMHGCSMKTEKELKRKGCIKLKTLFCCVHKLDFWQLCYCCTEQGHGWSGSSLILFDLLFATFVGNTSEMQAKS